MTATSPLIAAARERREEAIALMPFGVAALLAVVVFQPSVDNVTDVSWLIDVCLRMIEGQHLYTDIIETNPPMSIYLYLPFVYLAVKLGMRPEAIINLEVMGTALLSMALAWRILRNTNILQKLHRRLFAVLVWLVLMILPFNTFGQREHFGTMLILPILALAVARMEMAKPRPALAIMAGLCAGLAMCLKPQFALAIAPAYAFAIFRTKAPRIHALRLLLNWEIFVAGGVVALYAALTVVLTPAYFSTIFPLVRATYLPVRVSFWSLAPRLGVKLWLGTMALLAFLARERSPGNAVGVLIVASLGALGIYFLPGKGWPYHSLPQLILAFIALATMFCARGRAISPLAMFQIGLWAVLAIGSWQWFRPYQDDAIRDLQAKIAPMALHPRMMMIGSDIAVGHPLVRRLSGVWVGRMCAQWMETGAATLRAQSKLRGTWPGKYAPDIQQAVDFERKMLVEDIMIQQPDVILMQNSATQDFWLKWTQRHQDVAAALLIYQDRGVVSGVRILQRSAPWPRLVAKPIALKPSQAP